MYHIYFWRKMFILLTLIAAIGCTPTVYKQPIKDFSDTVTDSGFLLKAYLDANRQAVLSATVEKIVSERRRLSYTREDGSVKVIDTDYNLAPDTGQNAEELILKITRYANSLRAIAESNSRMELEGSIENLASSIYSLPGTRSQASSDQIIGSLKAVSGLMLDSKKYNIIKTAVIETNDDIQQSGDMLKRIIAKAKENAVIHQRNKLDRLIRQYNEVRTSPVNNELLLKKISADMRELRTQMAYNPTSVIDQMMNAHNALKDIAENQISEADLLKEIRNFQQAVIRARY